MRRLLFAILGACVVWLYAGTARALVVQWVTSADASYGLIVGGVALALVWQRRYLIGPTADTSLSSTAALLTLTTGLLLYLAGMLAADLFVTRASFVVVAAGLIWFLTGAAALKVMAAPLAFLLLAIPLPELVVNAVTLPLQLVASRVAEVSLSAAGVAVFRDGNVLELPSVVLQVAEACSGLRSAVSLVSVGVLLAWGTGGPGGRQAMLVGAAVPIAVLMNGIRVAATGLAAEAWGPAMTHGAWHTATGWITFVVSLLLLLAVERALPRHRQAILHPEVVRA